MMPARAMRSPVTPFVINVCGSLSSPEVEAIDNGWKAGLPAAPDAGCFVKKR